MTRLLWIWLWATVAVAHPILAAEKEKGKVDGDKVRDHKGALEGETPEQRKKRKEEEKKDRWPKDKRHVVPGE